jgi:hypothetical protein
MWCNHASPVCLRSHQNEIIPGWQTPTICRMNHSTKSKQILRIVLEFHSNWFFHPHSMETMSEFEEHNLYMKLQNIVKNRALDLEIPSWIRRFYRKLCVRKLKKSMVHEKLFDIDYALVNDKKTGDNILDRYQHVSLF